MRSFDIPDEWWGSGTWWGEAPPRSVVDLIDGGTLDTRLAALLWLAIQRHASLVVVGGHARGVGKTTLLTALMAFLAADARPVFTIGQRETFPFVGQTDPAHTRIMVNELSNHLPVYLWGTGAATVFDLARQGYAVAATIHAESLEELVAQTEDRSVGVSRQTFAERIPLAVLLSAGQRSGRLVRRVTQVLLLRPDSTTEAGVRQDAVSTWDHDADAFHFTDDPEVWAALAERLGLSPVELHREWDERRIYLNALVGGGMRDYDAVRNAVVQFEAR